MENEQLPNLEGCEELALDAAVLLLQHYPNMSDEELLMQLKRNPIFGMEIGLKGYFDEFFTTARTKLQENNNAPNTPNEFGVNLNDGKTNFAPNTPNKFGEKNGMITPKHQPLIGGVFGVIPPKRNYNGLPFGEINDLLLKPPEFVNRYIPKNHITILAAPPKEYKSTLALWWAVNAAAGRNSDGSKTEALKVAYVDEEDILAHLYQNISDIAANFKDEEKTLLKQNLVLFSQQNFSLNDYNSLKYMLEQHKPQLVVVDTMRRALGGDENDSEVIAEVFQKTLSPAMSEYGVTWLLLHHNRKPNPNSKNRGNGSDASEIRGSGDIYAISGSTIMLKRIGQDEFVLYHVGSKWAAESLPHLFKIDRTNGLIIEDLGEQEESFAADVKTAREIEEWLQANKLNDNITTAQIKTQFKEGGTTDRALDILKKDKKLIGKGKKNRSPFSYIPRAKAQPKQGLLEATP